MEGIGTQNIAGGNTTSTQLDLIQAHLTSVQKKLTTMQKKHNFLAGVTLTAIYRFTLLVLNWFCMKY
jgi:hypothetical protein